jgi:phytanoyl-CoA hydroxylase
LSEDVINYRSQGYVVLRGVLPICKIDSALATLQKMLCLVSKTEVSSVHEGLRLLKERDPKLYVSTLSAFSRSISLSSVLQDDSIVSYLDDIDISSPSLPTAPVLHVSSKDLVTNGGYLGHSAHQDWPSVVGSLNSVISWVPLTPIGENDHPLMVAPRSHLQGVMEGRVEDRGLIVEEKDLQFVNVTCSPGDVVIMSTFCAHKTNMSGTGFRIAASIRYNDVLQSEFAERGYPCAYRRSVDRELYRANIPTKDQINGIFLNGK